MNFPRHVWARLKNITADELISALKKDGWERDTKRGAQQIWKHPDGRRVSIHYHPKKTYQPKLLKSLLRDIGWTVDDMQRLKLI